MGIRASLEQQPDELKMQDFVIEDEPKPELKFDPKKELEAEDFEFMKRLVNLDKDQKNSVMLARTLFSLYQFQPEQTQNEFSNQEILDILKEGLLKKRK